jgi:hypothetical protein
MFNWWTVQFWYAIDFLQTYNGAVTASATVFIAIFTIVLACVTRRQAKLTNRAIHISERALLDLERGCLVPSFPNPVQPDWQAWHVAIVLSNVGRSYAIAKGVFVRTAEQVEELLPMPPDDGYIESETDTVIRAGDDFTGILPFRLPSTTEGQVLYGYIRYEDTFSRMWRNYFAVAIWTKEGRGRHFYQTVGGKAYNAEILEK